MTLLLTGGMHSSLQHALGSLSQVDVAVITLAAAFASHLCFRHFEPRNLLPIATLLGLVPALLSLPVSFHVNSPFIAVLVAFAAYNSFLVALTLAYRLSPLHPLAKYPGPVMARASKWWAAYVHSRGLMHRYVKSLHERYGDVVRVGPNELSIRDASIIHRVLGPGGLPKGPRWEGRPKPEALIEQRDPVLHLQQRKSWNLAFSSTALKEYETVVARRTRQLVARLQGIILDSGQKDGAAVDVCAWMNFFTTDFMGDMAFGGGFELMRDGGDKEGLWTLLQSNIYISSSLAHIPYILPVLNAIFGDKGSIQRARNFGKERVVERLTVGAQRKDLFYHLSGEELPEKERPQVGAIAQNGLLAIIAGSDTTSSTLTTMIYYLMRYPEAYQHLQKEVDAAFPSGEEPLDVVKLSRMEWLNGCINEALRLQPAVAGGSQRRVVKGKGATVLGDHMIPEDTQLFIHTYSIQRDPRNFHTPDAFLPQRWFSKGAPAGVHNPAAFIPFSYGPTICAGKNLAILEMRMVLCWIIRCFHFSRVSDVNLEEWEEGMKDWFVAHQEPLNARISLRG
ncbi:high nitrogen upregulated cytochrome P450 monooxygenase 2 [Gloeopeniophorella convolvens]|nr:high nitrogen upregulated cytochrome P450 monooxygenase 2 [Gloeopeniophorella convolvens]